MRGQKFGINAFWLKIIAVLAMTIDHVGYLFYPGEVWMRIIGRLTFPIMAFLLAQGYCYTRNLRKYELRLLVFAILSILPFYLAFGWAGNVYFTLLCALLALDCSSRCGSIWHEAAVVICFAVLSLPCDWGFSGVLAVYVFGRTDRKETAAVLGTAVLTLTTLLKNTVLTAVLGETLYPAQNYTVVFAILIASLPLLLYNGERGPSMKYWFYAYYPVHLTVLGFIAWVLHM